MQKRKEMKRQFSIWSLIFAIFIVGPLRRSATGTADLSLKLLATKESRRSVVYTEAGEITAVDVSNGRNDFGSYHLEFFTLDSRSLFLPVLLHADMIFYVHTGKGSISWLEKNKVEVLQVEPGDIYRLEEGTVFYIQSSGDPTREKLRIHAIFNSCGDEERLSEPFVGGAYSNISDLVRGFDAEVLQMGFGVSVEVIEGIMRAEKPPPIIPFKVKNGSENYKMDWREGIFEAVFGMRAVDVINEKKENKKAFNILKRKPDVKNGHGRSVAVTQKDEKSLKGSSMGVFMVNLTEGSMIGPHWNPKATEIAIVIEGHGMIQVICPSNPSGFGHQKFKTKRFYVKEGDVFVIPKFYPMAQMSFKNSSFVFVGFSNNGRKNHPQFLAGKWSVIQAMDREIMAASFNVTSETFGHLLAKQKEAVLLGCEGCAEEVKKKLEEEIEMKKEEEEEDRRRKEDEEAAKRREEEEKARQCEEEARRREDEKRREEERRREEEEEERRREEERKAEEEAEQRRAEEEAQRRKEEEEEREREKKEEEEEALRKWEEDEQREKERKEQERKAEEEAEQRRAEEEAQRRKEEEEEREREKKEEEEEALRKWEEDERREKESREQDEETRKRKRDEEAQRERERRKEEEEALKRREEEEEEQGESERKEEQKKEQKTKHEEEARKREEEEEEEQRKREEEHKVEWGEVGGKVKWIM